MYCERIEWGPIKNAFAPCWRVSDKASAEVLLRFHLKNYLRYRGAGWDV